jgi:spore maturation protein CgeB
MGNGLLTFMDNEKKFDHFFNDKEMIFFDNNKDLSDKLKFYKDNSQLRKKIAKNGQQKYFQLFNCIDIAKYIIERSMNPGSNYKPSWE